MERGVRGRWRGPRLTGPEDARVPISVEVVLCTLVSESESMGAARRGRARWAIYTKGLHNAAMFLEDLPTSTAARRLTNVVTSYRSIPLAGHGVVADS